MLAMPRFYFHVKRGQVTVLDHDGIELADIEEAIVEAARRGGTHATQSTLKGLQPGDVVVVADEQWRPLCEVPFDGDP